MQQAEEGGVSLFADGKHLYRVLAQQYPHILQALTTPNSAIFAGADVLLRSSVLSTLENGNICIRFRFDALGYYAAPVSEAIYLLLFGKR